MFRTWALASRFRCSSDLALEMQRAILTMYKFLLSVTRVCNRYTVSLLIDLGLSSSQVVCQATDTDCCQCPYIINWSCTGWLESRVSSDWYRLLPMFVRTGTHKCEDAAVEELATEIVAIHVLDVDITTFLLRGKKKPLQLPCWLCLASQCTYHMEIWFFL